MAQEDQDKTEQPTPYRLEEARKRGEVARSPEVTATVVMVAFALAVLAGGANVVRAIGDAVVSTFGLAGGKPTLSVGLLTWFDHAWSPVWQALMPLLLAVIVAAVAGNLLQTGPLFSSHPITPDPKRLNPVSGFKKLFSRRTLWELGKVLLKVGLLSLLGMVVLSQAAELIGLAAMGLPARLPDQLMSGFARTSLYVLGLLALIAVLDWLFVRRDFTRKLRMSRRELRDEHKRRDGDPEIKSKQKKLQRELLRKVRALARVGDADVVLTNPTHVAVALQYRPRSMKAPVVLAKGAGFLADRIRKVARRKGVPLRASPALARALYRDCQLDAPVPVQHFAELAPLYRDLIEGLRARGLA